MSDDSLAAARPSRTVNMPVSVKEGRQPSRRIPRVCDEKVIASLTGVRKEANKIAPRWRAVPGPAGNRLRPLLRAMVLLGARVAHRALGGLDGDGEAGHDVEE